MCSGRTGHSTAWRYFYHSKQALGRTGGSHCVCNLPLTDSRSVWHPAVTARSGQTVSQSAFNSPEMSFLTSFSRSITPQRDRQETHPAAPHCLRGPATLGRGYKGPGRTDRGRDTVLAIPLTASPPDASSFSLRGQRSNFLPRVGQLVSHGPSVLPSCFNRCLGSRSTVQKLHRCHNVPRATTTPPHLTVASPTMKAFLPFRP